MKRIYLIVLMTSILLLSLCIPGLAFEYGDRIRLGDDLIVSDDEAVNGDTVTIFGSQTIMGRVNGDVIAVFGDVEMVGGSVQGDVVSVFGDVILRENAIVAGDAIGVMGEIERFDDAIVSGEVTSVAPNMVFAEVTRRIPVHFSTNNFFIWKFSGWFGRMLLSILMTLVLIHFMLPNLEKIQGAIQKDPVRVGLKGLLGILVIIIVSILLAITIIGIPISIILGIANWIATMIGLAAIYLLVGKQVAENLKLENPTVYVQGVIGSVIFSILGVLPLAVGGLIKLLVSLLALGGVLVTKFGTGKPWIK